MSLLELALTAHRLGLCVVPPKEDGSKMPMVAWEEYQKHRPEPEQLERWYATGRTGIGLLCGAVSGNLEMLEFEGRAVADGLHQRYRELAEQAGLGETLTRILAGCSEQTPTGGIHLLYRCEESVSGNLKLARRPATTEELAKNPGDKIKVLIETRGEGGYVVTAPSNGRVHPSHEAYRFLKGGFESIATISGEEREALLDLARTFDQMPRQEVGNKTPAVVGSPRNDRPGDDFNVRANWSEILEPHGWRRLFTAHDGNEHWRRPGKNIGTSATINERGAGVLYVFSTSTKFEDLTAYTKFGAYGVLEHEGDFKAAASALKERGYGASSNGQVIPKDAKIIPLPDPREGWPRAPKEVAYYGLAGDAVELSRDYTEGDPIAVLGQFLALFGVAVGLKPHYEVGATRHSPRIFLGIVGKSAKARKGDSWSPVERLLTRADDMLMERILSGFGSGEALVHAVRDARYEDDREGRTKLVDQGVTDKRLLALETELARLLVAVGREGSTISQYVRDAFDGRPLRNLVKSNPAIALSHHIGIVGHSTAEELRGRLSEDQIRNGFANRFLWLAVRRDPGHMLPSPPAFTGPPVDALALEIRRRLTRAQQVERMYRSESAEVLWRRIYDQVSREDYGLAGALTERAEAQILRLSMIYALTDGAEVILPVHLEAAKALWDYSVRSVNYVFGGTTGDVLADRIVEDLRSGPMTTSELANETFQKNINARQLHGALELLFIRGLVTKEQVKTTGRPATRWTLLPETEGSGHGR